jgi:hypothetical protein
MRHIGKNRFVVRDGLDPIFESIQIETAQEYSSAADLVEYSPTFFARAMKHENYRIPGFDPRSI